MGLFVILHIVFLRMAGEEGVLRWSIGIFIFTSAVEFLGSFFYLATHKTQFQNLDPLSFMICLGLAFVLYGLLSFHYILWVFGPYESSLRLRLVRELASVYPKGLTRQDVANRYNREVILKRRLKRLIYARELLWDGKNYSRRHRASFFMISDTLSRGIESLCGFKKSNSASKY